MKDNVSILSYEIESEKMPLLSSGNLQLNNGDINDRIINQRRRLSARSGSFDQLILLH